MCRSGASLKPNQCVASPRHLQGVGNPPAHKTNLYAPNKRPIHAATAALKVKVFEPLNSSAPTNSIAPAVRSKERLLIGTSWLLCSKYGAESIAENTFSRAVTASNTLTDKMKSVAHLMLTS